MSDATAFARLLADRQRLAALGALALGSRKVDDIAALLDIEEREALRILGRLVASGLVVKEHGAYELDAEALRALAVQLTPTDPADPDMFRNLSDTEAGIAARFFRGRRLVEIPMQRGKRLAVLQRLVQEFEPGRRYSEAQVNLILGMFHPDHASLRRYLVDEGLLDRDAVVGSYWRSGGPVEIDETT